MSPHFDDPLLITSLVSATAMVLRICPTTGFRALGTVHFRVKTTRLFHVMRVFASPPIVAVDFGHTVFSQFVTGITQRSPGRTSFGNLP